MTEPSKEDTPIRDATADDGKEATRLFVEGRFIPDHGHHRDPGEDFAHFAESWLDHPTNRLWVAQGAPGRLAGMVGIREKNEGTAELCRLRVDPGYRNRGLGRKLVEHALAYCRANSYLRVILDSHVERAAAIALFERLGFRSAGEREVHGKRVMDFYLDLYTGPPST